MLEHGSRHGTEYHGRVQHGSAARHGTARKGNVRKDIDPHGMSQHGTADPGTSRQSKVRHPYHGSKSPKKNAHRTEWHGMMRQHHRMPAGWPHSPSAIAVGGLWCVGENVLHSAMHRYGLLALLPLIVFFCTEHANGKFREPRWQPIGGAAHQVFDEVLTCHIGPPHIGTWPPRRAA